MPEPDFGPLLRAFMEEARGLMDRCPDLTFPEALEALMEQSCQEGLLDEGSPAWQAARRLLDAARVAQATVDSYHLESN